jgi:hypothetical protein
MKTRLNCERLESRECPAFVTWTYEGQAPGDWHTPANWSTGTVPTVWDDVEIPGGSGPVSVAGTAEAGSLRVGYFGVAQLSGEFVTRGRTWVCDRGMSLADGATISAFKLIVDGPVFGTAARIYVNRETGVAVEGHGGMGPCPGSCTSSPG